MTSILPPPMATSTLSVDRSLHHQHHHHQRRRMSSPTPAAPSPAPHHRSLKHEEEEDHEEELPEEHEREREHSSGYHRQQHQQHHSLSGMGSPNSSSYAFITHSQEGLRDNLPPSIDNAGLARRRRRRTSQHDQAILEDEYAKCDRPDKVKRKEIAMKVEMGEKEVQIWFQNKRQSARRKLKPLLPQDLIPALRSSSPAAPHFRSSDHSHQTAHLQRTSSSSRPCTFEPSSSLGEEHFHSDEIHPYSGREMKEYSRSRSREEDTIVDGRAGTSGDAVTGMEQGFAGVPAKSATSTAATQPETTQHQQSSQNSHGYYSSSQQDSPDNKRAFANKTTTTSHQQQQEVTKERQPSVSLPPVPASAMPPILRRMSTTHVRLQEALSSDSPPPPSGYRRASHLHQTSEGDFFHSSDYQHDQQQLPAPPPAGLPETPYPKNPRRTNPALDSSSSKPYQPPSLLKRTSSFLRLSTNLEGKAEVIALVDASEPTLPPPLHASLSSYTGLDSTTTPRRPVPVFSSSSILREKSPHHNSIPDSVRRRTENSKVWQFFCDNQANLHGSSTDAPLGGKHGVPEPDEAGVALGVGVARSRGRTNEFGSSTPKFLFSNTGEGAGAEKKKLVGAESEGDLFGPAEGGSWKGDPGRDITKRRTLHSSHHHRDRKSRDGKAELPNNPETETRKLKKNLVPISHHLNHLDHSLPPHPPSSARKRAYHEILDENPEPHHNIHSFTPVKLSRSNSYSSKALIPPVLPASLKKSKSFAFGAGGGEDYYIPDHESDKENNDGPSLLSSSQPTIKSHYLSEQASTTTTTTTTKKMKPRPPRNSDIAKSTVAKMKNINAAPRRVASAPALKGSIGTGASNSNGTSAAMGIPKKRKVLGESRLSGSASSASSTSATISPPLLPSSKAYVPARTVGEEERERKKEERPRVEEGDLGDLGGAELLLSLSAGVWR